MKVAFVGLGQMGGGMAARLVAAGHQVTVWNRDASKTMPCASAALRWPTVRPTRREPVSY